MDRKSGLKVSQGHWLSHLPLHPSLHPAEADRLQTWETKTENSRCWQGCGETGTCVRCWQGVQWCGCCGKQRGVVGSEWEGHANTSQILGDTWERGALVATQGDCYLKMASRTHGGVSSFYGQVRVYWTQRPPHRKQVRAEGGAFFPVPEAGGDALACEHSVSVTPTDVALF